MLAALIYNVNRNKGARALDPGEFLKTPHEMKPKPKQPGELAASLKAAFSGLKKA